MRAIEQGAIRESLPPTTGMQVEEIGAGVLPFCITEQPVNMVTNGDSGGRQKDHFSSGYWDWPEGEGFPSFT